MKQGKMMKKLISILGAGVLAVSMLTGCSGKISNDLITINQYKGLKVKAVETAEVTDADVEASIQSTLETYGTLSDITDRGAQEGDYVTIDFVGKKDGVAFDNGSAEDQCFKLGSGGFIDGFEDGIVDHSAGEVFDIDVTFPEEYVLSEELAGQAVVFTITLDSVQELIVPELTDELVASTLSSTATTVEEYKAQEKANLETSNAQAAESEFEASVWQALLDNCVVEEYPEDELEEMLSAIETQYSSAATYYGMDVDTFVLNCYGITKQEMAESLLKQQYAIELIAEKEEITLTVAEYEEELEEYASRWGYTSEEMEELLGHDELEKMFIQERVGEWLIENCKVVE